MGKETTGGTYLTPVVYSEDQAEGWGDGSHCAATI